MNSENKLVSAMIDQSLIKVENAPRQIDLSDKSKYMKIESDIETGLAAFASQLPSMAAISNLSANSGMYVLRFPQGVNGTLTKLKQGGYSTALRGADGSFVGTASLFEAAPAGSILALQAVSAMAVVSGQYFLTQINSEMKLINQNIDKILDFLYGDKKAELLSEICFVQRAMRDYVSIMRHDAQRLATLTNIQEAEKIAMKDVEFYMNELDRAVRVKLSETKDIKNATQNVLQICDSLNASLQLYIMSCTLEVYYSQNTDKSFIENLKTDLNLYVDKCHSRILADVSNLKGRIDGAQPTGVFMKQTLKKEPSLQALSEITDKLSQGKTQGLQQSVCDSLDSTCHEMTFITTDSGEVYYQTA